MSTDRRNSILSIALVVFVVLGSVPVLEMGLYDDWSYADVAREFAATGHFKYNGWFGAMVGLQIGWAALLIRIFGFSFTLLRLSTLPFAAGGAFLSYKLARMAGLNPAYALFAALSITLSPIYIPMAASYMTDVPGFFFWMACFYCAVRACQASDAMRASGWIALAACAGVAGGTIRQIVWIAPFMVLPSVAFVRRKDRLVLAATSVLWIVSALVVWMCIRWFATVLPVAEPSVATNAISPPPDVLRILVRLLRYVARLGLQIVVTILLLILPVMASYLAGWKKFSWRPYAVALGLLASGAIFGMSRWYFHDSFLLGNIVTATGILDPQAEAMGVKPETLPGLVRGLLELAVFLATAVTMAFLFGSLGEWVKSLRRGVWFGSLSAPFQLFVFLLAPSSFIYILAVVYHGLDMRLIQNLPSYLAYAPHLFDRYVIPLLPIFVIPILWGYQQTTRRAPPVLGWALLGLFAFYGVATTHDYLAAGRARLQAATVVTANNIPRVRLTAGFEYDGWTEIEYSGLIAPGPDSEDWGHRYPLSPPFWFWAYTPSIQPRYFVLYSRMGSLVDSPFPPISYTTWLPPFRRQVFTQMAP